MRLMRKRRRDLRDRGLKIYENLYHIILRVYLKSDVSITLDNIIM